MKPERVRLTTCIDYGVEHNEKHPKLKFAHVRISKQKKNIFEVLYWSEKVFYIKKIKIALPWTYVIWDLNSVKSSRIFYVKELQKTSQTEFMIRKVIRRKSDELCVKWKGYYNSFSRQIDMKDTV